MAEVAGLALGVVGLAGVVGAFKDVVDLFSLFADTKHLGRDYEILDTKLDIEKTILLLWADRVGLLRPDYDRRLDLPDTQVTVFRALACIRSLLSDASQLKTRYGVETFGVQDLAESSKAISAPDNPRRAISSRPMERLARELDNMRLRMQIPEQTSRKNKFRWVVRDKQRFGNLLSELSHFTTRLNDLVPATSALGIAQTDLQPAQNLHDLKIALEESADFDEPSIADAAQEAIDQKSQERILDILWFRTMTAREDEIKPAYAKTLDWALEPPEGNGQWDDLSEWLTSGEGIYWVSGKAGSGKSTLMKRLSRHPRTRELLSGWASGGSFNLVSFFFWNLGAPEQKTQEGLSRSLLHQILTRHPSLIREALPGMWKELKRTDKDVSLPSPTETRHAFRVLASKASELGKFCFLIDGLGEFSGDYRNAIDFIKELTRNAGLKAIVSSRPIPDCVAAFEDNPRLELHKLTRNDIITYVSDIIGRHKYMERLMNRYAYEVQ
jgi:hypothetical protein